MKGSILMSKHKNIIEKICKFTLLFSNMNTLFIDSNLNAMIEYNVNQIPEILKEYLGNISDILNVHEKNSEYDVFFYSNYCKLNFISARVYDDIDYLGNIVLGPYLLEEPTALMIEDVIFKNNFPISLRHIINQYYLSLPVISAYKAKTIAEFLQYIASNLHSMNFENSKIGNITYNFQTKYNTPDIIKKNTEISMALIEKRYCNENELLHAIKNGNRENLEKFLNERLTSISKIPDRIPNDPLRSRKNLTIALNTLLRKAAEKGGVHPVYIDSISEKFAIQIEKTYSIQQLSDLQNKIYLDYCDAVNKFSLKKLNYPVRKAVEFIRMNLNQNLSLNVICNSINVHPHQLTKQFKKETGESITEYINKLRVNEAIYIMDNQNISITSIANMVGFNDINYFTKVFKKLKGITPSEYRKALN